MAERDYMRSPASTTRQTAAVLDRGLQSYMTRVYALMTGAMLITGVVAYIVGMDFNAVVHQQPTTLIPSGAIIAMYTSPIRWVIMFAPLIFVMIFGATINRMSSSTAQTVFWVFSGVMGLSIAWIFAFFTQMSIAQTFFATAIGFGAMSLYGYTTRRDLSGMGSFLMMGVFGLIGAMLLNIFFFQSTALQWAVSLIGVLLFAGLTAFDTQAIRNEYLAMRATPAGETYLGHAAVMGALRLYLDFLNMFMFLLQFMGNRQ